MVEVAVSASVLVSGLWAQGQGQWVAAFDHQHAVTGIATPATAPFSYPGGPLWPTRDVAPNATTTPVQGPTLNAIHMSLIPAGVHQGKVIAWGQGSLLAYAAPFAPPTELWSYQAYSIVDPRLAPPGDRFLNFFLPLDSAATQSVARDLFCTGHAWSPFGYLVVAGGTRYVPGLPDNAADMVFTFDPQFANAPFPTNPAGPSLYNDAGSLWTRENVMLTKQRYYPTTTMTNRFPRVLAGQPVQVETMLVLGGSEIGSVPGPTWNTYEALILTDVSLTNPQRIYKDTLGTNDTVWWGPSDPNVVPYDPFFDSFLEYPRTHLLGNGRLFLAGDVPRSAQVDHSFIAGSLMPAPWPSAAWTQQWNTAAGAPTSASEYRTEGSSVLLVNGTGFPDLVVRLGGRANGVASNLVEVCAASTAGTSWLGAAQNVPQLTFAREHPNAVVLPDLSIVVFGGHDADNSVLIPELFKWGTGGWQQQAAAQSPRNYHSTAILTPSGHVLVAGGNDRHPSPHLGFDYELFAPPYLTGTPPPVRPQGIDIPNATAIQMHAGADTFELARNGTFNVTVSDLPLDSRLAKFVLITPGSCTHHSDMHQRYVECTILAVTETMMTFTLPTEQQAPRGYYMAFVVTEKGIPAEAVWVWLR